MVGQWPVGGAPLALSVTYAEKVLARGHAVALTRGCKSPECKGVLPHCEPPGHPPQTQLTAT